VSILLHIPHSSDYIPESVRRGIYLNDAELKAELLKLTDSHASTLFTPLRPLPANSAQSIFTFSRLVVDVERYRYDEPMEKVGMGAIYTLTSGGEPLRSSSERDDLLDRFYTPYHETLVKLVGAVLDATGKCLILDCHTFASAPMPDEPDQSTDRPDICLGTDSDHTPHELLHSLCRVFKADGFTVEVDRPFSGSMMPDAWRNHPAVATIMVEVNRKLYMNEKTGDKLPGFDALKKRLWQGLGSVISGV
jgi:N-formylglutamate deformylase